MLRSTPEWEQYERDAVRNSRLTYMEKLQIAQQMWDLVSHLGKNPLIENPMGGIEDDINLAKAMNVRLKLR